MGFNSGFKGLTCLSKTLTYEIDKILGFFSNLFTSDISGYSHKVLKLKE